MAASVKVKENGQDMAHFKYNGASAQQGGLHIKTGAKPVH